MRRIRKLYTSRVLPLVYDYSLSVTEMVGKLIRAVNDMADDVTDNTDDIETVRYQAREEIAMKKMLDAEGCMAFTNTFQDLYGMEQLPGLASQHLMAQGYGYGGGVCQVTTTLYNAVLTLPLQVEAWELHQYIGVAYVPQFFDAAVGSHSDFSFTNLLPYPIQLQALPQDGALTVLLLRAE